MQLKPFLNHTFFMFLKIYSVRFYQRLKLFNEYTSTVCFLLLLSLLLMSGFPGSAVAGPPGHGSGPPPLVKIAAVIEQDVNPSDCYVGHVEAIQAVDLQARVEGFLELVNFKEGSYVHAGDMLYIIEQELYQARVDMDRARIAKAQAVLTKAGQYLRQVQTVHSGGVSASDIDTAVADEFQAKAQLQEAKASLKQSELDLGYTKIFAPINGRIGLTKFTRGNLVGPNSGYLARIVQTDPIRVVFSISENHLAAIKTAIKDASNGKNNYILTPKLKLLNGEIIKNPGHIDFVDNEIDASTGTIAVRAVFDNKSGLLIPGQYVNVLLSRKKAKMLPVVPQAAVQEDRQGRYVLIVDSRNMVIQRRITTGPTVGINWAVKSGLSAGDMVIVQGVQKVQPGLTVRTLIKNEKRER